MHAQWEPATDRRDAVATLGEQERGRIAELLPIRHQRMAASPLAFLRGAAAVMAEDLANTPVSGLRVQACGDAHLLNFGIFATPERRLVFDVNDFDETLRAPFEWDVKRLAASLTVAGRQRRFSKKRCHHSARAAAEAYRTTINRCADMGHLEVWYLGSDVGDLLSTMRKSEARGFASDVLRPAHHATGLGALDKLTEVSRGELQIVDTPPLIEHLPSLNGAARVPLVLSRYRASLADDRRRLLDRYSIVDWARKVVGVGSVGTDDAVVLALGDTDNDPLFLQVKQAQASVLEPFVGASTYANHGQRVVCGQRLMQAASDIFLGWTRIEGRDYYVRQLRDMKASVPIERLSPRELTEYGRACGAALGRAHARSGDPVAISAYLGASDAFDCAVGQFAEAYADQSEADYAAFVSAMNAASDGTHDAKHAQAAR